MIITIKVKVRARKQGCLIDKNGIIVCGIKSPPEGGKANQELIVLLASLLKIPQKSITFLKGQKNQLKTLSLDTPLSLQEIIQKLCQEL